MRSALPEQAVYSATASTIDCNDALNIVALQKSFGANVVLDSVNMHIGRGEIRALLGLNGSGKSTLIKILSGFYSADGGQVAVGGQPLELTGSAQRAHLGMRFVHQDLALAPHLSAVDNMALSAGYPQTRLGTVAWRRAREQARTSLTALGYDFDPRLAIFELTAVERAGTAIARAVSAGGGRVNLLVLDEPTAALPAHECSRLFDAVRRLADSGTAVLYVTHHLDEVFELAGRVSVLRNGRIVDDALVSERTQDELIEAMSGRPVVRNAPSAGKADANVMSLQVSGLRTTRLHGIDFHASVGEIVGIAGITGSGREQVAPALMGAAPREGRVQIGTCVIRALRPKRSVAAGMACIPANRISDALFPAMSVQENITVADLRSIGGSTFIRRGREQRAARALIKRLSVRPEKLNAGVTTLSGGNQQKVVLGRWLSGDRAVVVLDEPTQGVDVTARVTVYSELRQVSAKTAVVVCSSDSDELAELCDRVLILRDGFIVAQLHAPMSAAQIDALCLGSEPESSNR